MRLIGNGFVADLPVGWEDRTLTTLVGTIGRTGFTSNVVISRELVPDDTVVADYARAQLDAAPISDLQVISEHPTLVYGAPAHQRMQRFRAEGYEVQQQQTFVRGRGIVFVITCTATAEEFDEQLPLFRCVLESFRMFDVDAALS